jgi:hypothetical protein
MKKLKIIGQWAFYLPVNVVLISGATILGLLWRLLHMPYDLLQAIAYDENIKLTEQHDSE